MYSTNSYVFFTVSEYGLQGWGVWFEPDRRLRYYDISANISSTILVYRRKLCTINVDILDGEIRTILVDISQPVSQLILAICTDVGIMNHENFGFKLVDYDDPGEYIEFIGKLTFNEIPSVAYSLVSIHVSFQF